MTSLDASTSDVCVPNIGPRERRKRLAAGATYLVIALVTAAIVFGIGAGRPWRLVLFFPLWAAGLGYFQYREKT